MMLVLSDAYRRQYGFDSCVPIVANLYGPARQLRPRGLARHRGDDPQVRRGPRPRRRAGRPVGHGLGVARVPLRRRRRARAAARRRAPRPLGARERRHRRRDADPRPRRDDPRARRPRGRGRSGTRRKPDGQPTRYLDVARARELDGLRGRDAAARGPARGRSRASASTTPWRRDGARAARSITGISGQDGSYLAELLLGKGYEVFGIVRGSPTAHYENLAAIRDDVTLLQGDLLDQMTLLEAINTAAARRALQPRRHLVRAGVVAPAGDDRAVHRGRRDGDARGDPHHEARACASTRRARARSSARRRESPQSETTPFRPHNPYGVAKLYGHLMLGAYRERYGMHLSSGIAYNHESPRRPPEFVTRKVTRAAAAIKLGLQDELRVGDLAATRDWGFARRLRRGDVAHAPAGRAAATTSSPPGVSRIGRRARRDGVRPRRPRRRGLRRGRPRVRPAARPGARSSATRRKARERLGWEPRDGVRAT